MPLVWNSRRREIRCVHPPVLPRWGAPHPLLEAMELLDPIGSKEAEDERMVTKRRLADLYERWGKPEQAALYASPKRDEGT